MPVFLTLGFYRNYSHTACTNNHQDQLMASRQSCRGSDYSEHQLIRHVYPQITDFYTLGAFQALMLHVHMFCISLALILVPGIAFAQNTANP
ncbi:MAG: hypothetical protein EB829_00250, partial [Nitrosopumilus sp. H8]